MAQTTKRSDKQLNVLAQPWFPSMTMARQRVTVYDLYGLLGVCPNVDEDGLRAAYDAITEKHKQVPSDVINAAYSVLTNPFKRAQYDRDRLEYLYRQFSDHEAFPPTTSVAPANIKGRDDQIQVYASHLVERVRDPTEEKRRAITRRIETTRAELDEFNERSGRQRQDWATSANRVLRMAGNALCEVVVCAEEDLRMLEDELGRIDGRLSPRDPEGPAGRVTSGGCYGSEIMALPTGTMTSADKNNRKLTSAATDAAQPRVLMDKETPRIPRSPTVRFLPQSASKLGMDGAAEYTPSSEGSQEAREAQGNIRVTDFLLDKANPDRRAPAGRLPNLNNLTIADAARPSGPTLLETLRASAGLNLERVGMDHPDNTNTSGNKQPPNDSGAMGLVAWQRINNNTNPTIKNPPPGTPKQQQPQQQSPISQPESNKRSNSHPPTTTTSSTTDLSAYNKPYDPTRTHSADMLLNRDPGPPLAPPPPMAWRGSWDAAYKSRLPGGGGDGDQGYVDGREVYGRGSPNVTAPSAAAAAAAHHNDNMGMGMGVGATATNTVRFKEVQDRAAALARVQDRWVVGGRGLTNYGGGGAGAGAVRGGAGGSADEEGEEESRAEDPFA